MGIQQPENNRVQKGAVYQLIVRFLSAFFPVWFILIMKASIYRTCGNPKYFKKNPETLENFTI